MYDAKRFSQLFSGLAEAHGIWHTEAVKRKTVRSPATLEMYKAHLMGQMHLGVCPIKSDNTCVFGAIDIDVEIDAKKMAETIAAYDLPLICCQSKSGGAHLYAFKRKPLSAKIMRRNLQRYAEILGHGNSEIFPKQDILVENSLGNWINLPYQNVKNTNRFAYVDGSKQSLEGFMDAAEGIMEHRQKRKTVSNRLPPCMAYIVENGCPVGGRNQALYQFGVFYKKSQPDEWEDRVYEINYQVMDPPLSQGEVSNIVRSLVKKDYHYKCEEIPMCDICVKDVCTTIPFGVVGELSSKIDFGNLIKVIKGKEVYWIVELNKQRVRLESSELIDFRRCRVKFMEVVNAVLPGMKTEVWEEFVNSKLLKAVVEIVDESATDAGFIYMALCQWAQDTTCTQDAKNLLRNLPVMRIVDKIDSLVFRPADFLDHLRRKGTKLSGSELWESLEGYRIKVNRITVGKKRIRVWSLPWSENDMSRAVIEEIAVTTDEKISI